MSDERRQEAEARLEERLGHKFQRRALFEEALTHRSFANETKLAGIVDNERLEFLGDSVLGMVVSALLFERYGAAKEGELTRRRADIVCEPSLAAAARRVGLGEALRVGRGEAQSGGRDKPRLLACGLEACVGAVFLDGGFGAAFELVRRLFEAQVLASELGADDHKSRLQELVQAEGGRAPEYEVVSAEGPDHARVFRVKVAFRVPGHAPVEGLGEGRSKVDAEQAAAKGVLASPEGVGRRG